MSAPEAATPRASEWTFKTTVHFRTGAKGRKHLGEGAAAAPVPVVPGRVPRAARLLALAMRFEGLLRSGEVKDYADLARLAGVTRARMTQIMNLLLLAPDIQEAILDLPRTLAGRDAVTERLLRQIVVQPEWARQRALWRQVPESTAGHRIGLVETCSAQHRAGS
jgi:hypothetical protein